MRVSYPKHSARVGANMSLATPYAVFEGGSDAVNAQAVRVTKADSEVAVRVESQSMSTASSSSTFRRLSDCGSAC